MENFENLSQEELLAAAEAAYKQATPTPSASKEQTIPTEVDPLGEDLPHREDEPALGDEEPTEQDNVEEQKELSVANKTISTNGTAIGIAVGLVVGAAAGFLTGMIPACLTLGILSGVLVGLFFDVQKDKKANAPKSDQESYSVITPEDTIPEEIATQEDTINE